MCIDKDERADVQKFGLSIGALSSQNSGVLS